MRILIGYDGSEFADDAVTDLCRAGLPSDAVVGFRDQLEDSVFNFAVNEGWIDRNPARGLRVVDPVRRRDKRLRGTAGLVTRAGHDCRRDIECTKN